MSILTFYCFPLPVQPRTWVTYVPGSDPPLSPPLRGVGSTSQRPPGEGKAVIGQPLHSVESLLRRARFLTLRRRRKAHSQKVATCLAHMRLLYFRQKVSSWLCLRLYCAEPSVQLGGGFSLLYILNIEYRTRNFEQQKFLKAVRQCFSLRYSAVPCSAVHILNDVIADS